MANYYVTTSGSDSNAGTSEGAAFASPGKAASVATTSGDVIYVKSGTYTLSSSSNNVSGGRITISAGVRMEGYSTTPGDRAALPVINAGAITSIDIVTLTGGFNNRLACICFMEIDGNNGTGNRGVTPTSFFSNIFSCVARNCKNVGFYASSTGSSQQIANCHAIACNYGFQGWHTTFACSAKSCTSVGFFNIERHLFSLAVNNGSHGFQGYTYPCCAINCIAHGNTGSGFVFPFDMVGFYNCIATNNGSYGLSVDGKGALSFNFAHRSNTLGAFSYTPENAVSTIALTADPFTNAAGDNFTLNTTAGGGAALRAAGFPGLPASGNSRGYLDIGTFQHQDAAVPSIAFNPVRIPC